MERASIDLINCIRDHINRSEKQINLLSDLNKWCRLTSALDVLEDASYAINYYCDNPYPDVTSGKYLYTYGLLQAFFMLEDAINSINISLFDEEIDFRKDYPNANEVRQMRNDILHPTLRGKDNYIYLAQCSLGKEGFYYIKENGTDGSYASHDVNVYAAINDVAVCINAVLSLAIKRLNNEFRDYLRMHKDRKMKEIFSNLHYARKKAVLETGTYMGQYGYDATKAMVEKVEEELAARYGTPDSIDTYKYLLEDIHEIYSLIDSGLERIPSDIIAAIKKNLLENLFHKLEELEKCCSEIDEYFEECDRQFDVSENGDEV